MIAFIPLLEFAALPQAPLWPTVLAGQAHEGIIGGAEGVADHDVSDTALDRIGAQACGLSQDVGAGGGLLGGSAGGARESREVPPQGLGRQVFSSAISIRVPVVGQSIFESYSGAAGAKYPDMAAITSRGLRSLSWEAAGYSISTQDMMPGDSSVRPTCELACPIGFH